uniref:HAT C-terminal dimerisation domain-containing protein n=1 Tax=Chrysemys picta bellii TaxID=8478 RepID=A0A8C3FTF5_CHRPI
LLTILTRHVNSLTVKPLSQTRWESRIDALKPLRYELGNIYDALIEMSGDTTFTRSSGNTARSDAEALANGLSKFKFVTSLILWYNSLFEINLTSKQLQEKNLNIHSAIQKLQQTKNILEEFRSDEGFKRTLVDSLKLAEEIDFPAEFEPEPIHIRQKKQQFSYEGRDTLIQNPKQRFKMNFYFAVLDTAIHSVNERFQQMQQLESVFGFLYDIHSLQKKTAKQIREFYIDATDLCSELQTFSRRFKKHSTPEEVLKFVCENKLTDSFPNIFIALRILLTLPVSVASGERSFSKLKLIKTYLRSTMVQERLVGLATMSIEHEIAEKLDLKELVTELSKLKARKVMF